MMSFTHLNIQWGIPYYNFDIVASEGWWEKENSTLVDMNVGVQLIPLCQRKDKDLAWTNV